MGQLHLDVQDFKSSKTRTIDRVIDSMDSDDKQAFHYFVGMIIHERQNLPQHRRTFTVAALHELLRKNNYEIGKTALSEYVQGEMNDTGS